MIVPIEVKIRSFNELKNAYNRTGKLMEELVRAKEEYETIPKHLCDCIRREAENMIKDLNILTR